MTKEPIEATAKRVLETRRFSSDATSHDLCLLATAVLDLQEQLYQWKQIAKEAEARKPVWDKFDEIANLIGLEGMVAAAEREQELRSLMTEEEFHEAYKSLMADALWGPKAK